MVCIMVCGCENCGKKDTKKILPIAGSLNSFPYVVKFNFRFRKNFEVFTISTVLNISEFANEFKKVRKNYESIFKLMYIIGIHVIRKKMYAVILSMVNPKDHTVLVL